MYRLHKAHICDSLRCRIMIEKNGIRAVLRLIKQIKNVIERLGFNILQSFFEDQLKE